MHKSDDDIKSHEVSGRKGVEPTSTDVVTEISDVVQDHVNDLKNLKKTRIPTVPTTTTPTTTTTTTLKTTTKTDLRVRTTPPTKEPVVNDTTPKTSMLVGVILACILFSVVAFVVFKRLDAIRRRREYRRMNDYLIDGMYNEM